MASFVSYYTQPLFFDPNNRVARYLNTQQGEDKLFKFLANGFFPVSIEIARFANAPKEVIDNLELGRTIAKGVRDITGMVNIFRGSIAKSTGAGVQKVLDYKASLEEGDPEEASSLRTEKLLKLSSAVCELVSAVAFTLGFGLSRPAANIRKYFKVEYGQVGNSLADAFPYIMTVNHLFTFLKACFEFSCGIKVRNREIEEGNGFDNSYSRFKSIDEKSSPKLFSIALCIVEKLLSLVKDGLFLTRTVTPRAVSVPLDFTIASLSLYRAIMKTA